MKTKFFNALSLAVIMAMLFTSVGFADQIVNDIDTTVDPTLEVRTVAVGVSTVVGFYVKTENNIPIGDINGCNATGAEPAYVTLSVPANVSASSTSLTFTGCGNSSTTTQYVTFSSNVPGSYIISVSAVTGGKTGSLWNTAPANFTLTVTGKFNQTITVTTPAPATAVYGSSFGVAATASSGLPVAITTGGVCSGSGSGSATVTMTSGTGTCSVFYNQAGNASYNPAPQVQNSTTAQKATATVSVNGFSGAYDGLAHGASGSATGVGGADLSAGLNLGASFINVPGGTANWSFSGGANYGDQSGTSSIVISAAPVTATAGGGTSTYDGSSKSPSDCVVTGLYLYTGDLSCVNDPASVGPDAGTTTIAPVVSGTGLTNFDVSEVNGSYTIDKADATCTITGFTGVYDGLPHGATGSCTGVGGVDLSADLTLGVSFTDFPGGTAYWTFSGGTNYNDQNGSVAIVINKAPVTATAGSGSSVFDGSAKSPSACYVGGAYTGDLTCANSPDSVGPDAGTYAISPVVSGTGLGNFDVSEVNGSYTINKADAVCTITGWTGFYDGAFHGASGSCTGIGGATLSGLDLGATFKNVPGGTANWTFSGGTNYNNQSGSVGIVINAWTLNGFYQPVDMDKLNTVKGGSTVPLKFELFVGGTELTDISAIQSLQAYQVACVSGAVEDTIETVSTGGTSLRYDWTSGQFIFNWQTPKKAGFCYKVIMTAQDGSTLFANFKLK